MQTEIGKRIVNLAQKIEKAALAMKQAADEIKEIMKSTKAPEDKT